jgi:hypothetical protein
MDLSTHGGHSTDPKLKRWETGLVCEHCKRKAVALTYIKPGDIWDKEKWSRRYVGKRICQRCASRSLNAIFGPKRLLANMGVFEKLMIVQAIVFFASVAGFAVTSLSHVPPTIPLVLFLAAIGIFLIRIPVMIFTRKKQPTPLRPSEPSIPLINIEGFFDA